MMNRCDLIVIINSNLTKEDTDLIISSYKEIIENLKGKILKIEKWGIRKLAYQIKKNIRGFYVFFDFLGDILTTNNLIEKIKFDERILRYQIVKQNKKLTIIDIEKNLLGNEENLNTGLNEENLNTGLNEENLNTGLNEENLIMTE